MPTNKNAIIRYRVLDRCFRNTGRRYYIENLIEACSMTLSEMSSRPFQISRRTILADIAFMESEAGWGSKGINIQHIRDEGGKKVYYRYADPKFSIENVPLSSIELSQLQSALDILSQFKGFPQFEWMDDILHKLEYSADSSIRHIVSFDTNPYLKGIEYIDLLYQAIKSKQVLCIHYQSFNWNTDENFTFHPYFLKQYNNRWFIFGYNAEYSVPDWNMALDRIKKIIQLPKEQYIENYIDWDEYFSDIIGVSNLKSSSIETVILHCYGKCGKYIENKPIHESQISKWISPDCLEIKLRLKPNFELENFILGQGDGIKVISPTKLQKTVKMRLLSAIQLYK